MKQAGLSQTQVAGALEVSRTTLFYRLSGARPFNVDELEKLAPLVGREPESFYTQASSEDAA